MSFFKLFIEAVDIYRYLTLFRRGHGKLPKIRDFDIAIEYTIVYVLARPNFVRPNMTGAKLLEQNKLHLIPTTVC